ncbi:MAG: Ku protein [Coriobacteriia bacterium]|nr:Ku protein [Coriobacteriia bacterium]
MPNAIWKGSISFGLVTIPVSLFSAEDAEARLSFRLLDERDLAPVRNRRVNSKTGKDVPWEHIVKGYEIEEGHWIVLTEDDFRAANVEATQTIDVLAAVCAEDIDSKYFDKPYYLEPTKAGRKAYALLREALREAGRVAVCRIVIRTREHLAALVPDEDALVLEIIRFPYELRGTQDLDLPSADLGAAGVTDAELAMAKQLLASIEKPFAAEEYRDTYRDDLLALIENKAGGGEVAVPAPPAEEAEGEVVDIMELLKRSLEEASGKQA